MRIVTRNEGVMEAIDELIAKLETDLSGAKLRLFLPVIYVAALEHKIATLKQIELDKPLTDEQSNILFNEGYLPLFVCQECGSSIRSKLIEFGHEDNKVRVCFVCLARADELENK